ncbi:MAG: acyltransferase [Bacteroidales bacterium]|nr:acyltransferase [Bacteroidales bacterium]MCF8386286.1 acyltransferase [Bacteroidales bacterium]MCF8397539.1 acyltransferase [Bacteroidales bacterium]
MKDHKALRSQIFSIRSEQDFNAAALEIFHYQYEQNKVYREFCDLLKTRPHAIDQFTEIPFLPIEFFKTHKVLCTDHKSEIEFKSSGTSGSIPSIHYVTDSDLYRQSFLTAFELFYGKVDEYCILALLPSYLERNDSSLVYMVNEFIQRSQHPDSGFYLDNLNDLANTLKRQKEKQSKTLLIGVSFALLELAEKYPINFPGLMLMETGGMKGRRKEMIREELHAILKTAFVLQQVHSEYGMTELLSQAYARENGQFQSPPWMKILIRDINDPLSLQKGKRSGGINIIDLANIHSCSFIATQDLGRLNPDGSFEVLGRFDNSDVRGCNLMVM